MKQAQKRKPRRRNDGSPAARVVRSPPAPPRPRARIASDAANDNGSSLSLHRLGYTAAGAAGTALTGSILAKQGWAPKTIAGALTAVGAGLAWKGDGEKVRSVGSGVMSAAGSQLALMIIDDHDAKKAEEAKPTKKPSNADELPPGALRSAMDRARMRMAWSEEQQNAVLDAA